MFCLPNEKPSAGSRGAMTSSKHSEYKNSLEGKDGTLLRTIRSPLHCHDCFTAIIFFPPPSIHGRGFTLGPRKHKTSATVLCVGRQLSCAV